MRKIESTLPPPYSVPYNLFSLLYTSEEFTCITNTDLTLQYVFLKTATQNVQVVNSVMWYLLCSLPAPGFWVEIHYYFVL